jgi:hypothetical protein
VASVVLDVDYRLCQQGLHIPVVSVLISKCTLGRLVLLHFGGSINIILLAVMLTYDSMMLEAIAFC